MKIGRRVGGFCRYGGELVLVAWLASSRFLACLPGTNVNRVRVTLFVTVFVCMEGR